ncbi:MAG: triose-phosphate isomerase [Phycisphaerales bacterium]
MTTRALRRPFVGGNWKMNGDRASSIELARAVAAGVSAGARYAEVESVVFPVFPYLLACGELLSAGGAGVMLGGQDAYLGSKGAFTGEVAPHMLVDCGCRWVLCGHSERRHILHEGDDMVNAKVRAALGAGLSVVVCGGEKLEQRLTGQTDTVNERQVERGLRDVSAEELARIVIAYEPVWAIGTGKNATPDDAQLAHQHIRGVVANMFGGGAAERVRIIYGGSCNPANAAAIFKMPDVDGGLIGGASLKAAEFLSIIGAAVGSTGG